MGKTYTFRTYNVDGTKTERVLEARNMKVAVAKFANGRFPHGMSTTVELTGGTAVYPVTRERWGHHYDGYC